MMALLEVRGGEHDQTEAKAACEARGWPVVEDLPRGEGVSAGVLTPAAGSRLLWVEVRLFGAARRAERGAAWRVQRMARKSRLEVYVRRAEVLDHDRELLPEWQAHTIAHRPAVPDRTDAGASQWRAYRWARTLARLTEHAGWRDAGIAVTGTPSEARRLARMPREGGAAGRRDLDVRARDGRARTPGSLSREDDLNGRLSVLSVWMVATAWLAVLARDNAGVTRLVTVCLALLTFGAAVWCGGRLAPERPRPGAVVTGLVVLFAVSLWLGDPFNSTYRLSSPQALLIVVGTVVAVGLWLLVRQWTLGEWLTWGGPILATLVVSSLVAAGSVLHAFYADGLALSPGDLEVAGIWQVIAAVELVSLCAPLLLVPACYGLAKHHHYVRSASFGGLTAVVILLALGALALQQIMGSASQAVGEVKAAAEERGELPSYFGVRPAWTCVRPVVPRDELASRGGRIDPDHPYVSFGMAGADVVLMDAEGENSLKLPAKQVRLVPADAPYESCARS
ncbi:NnrS multi-domain protein [Streptomyces oceani]|uniref:NnrS multi-domain protein n=1 Tax=Streptomyces oceani TaxID=1075402 RepID=UPI001112D9DB|nr:NnrS multi-domain protein [Streptomyces oceani]